MNEIMIAVGQQWSCPDDNWTRDVVAILGPNLVLTRLSHQHNGHMTLDTVTTDYLANTCRLIQHADGRYVR